MIWGGGGGGGGVVPCVGVCQLILLFVSPVTSIGYGVCVHCVVFADLAVCV